MKSILLTTLIGILSITSALAAYQMKNAPLMTQWSKQVSPTNALPDYPRPQMVRSQWLNLNGLWEFSTAHEGEAAPYGRTLPENILVPYPVEAPLSGLMRREDRMWYRRTFSIPKDWQGQHVLLHFGAVNWLATVYVNGKEIGKHQGAYGSFTFDITDNLIKAGENELIVNAYDPADLGNQPVGKQTRDPRGYWYTASSGIWQTVWLEPVPEAHISRLDMVPDIEHGTLHLTVQGDGTSDQIVEAVASTHGTIVGEAKGAIGREMEIPVPNAQLWSPDNPFLYDIKVVLKNGPSVIDTVTGYFGMRSITVGKVNGIARPLLNGKFVFLLGPLDQGFWPDGNYTAPTDEALRFDLEQDKKCGYNFLRKHIKVEPARWYYWADKLGILVAQDMPSTPSRGLLPNLTEKKTRDEQTPEIKKEFEDEFLEMVDQLRSTPCIIGWIEFNEGWGEYKDPSEVTRLANKIKNYDPSRIMIAETGCFSSEAGDVLDWHTYPGPGCPPPSTKRFAGQGEFGGRAFVIKDHSWTPANKNQDTADKYTAVYVDMIHRIKAFMYSPGLSYAVFTQITDVENERNGLLTYDRAVFKGDLTQMRQANEDVIATSSLATQPLTDSIQDNFTTGSDQWTPKEGSWNINAGGYESSSGISLIKTNFNNFSCDADVTLQPGGEAGLMFRVTNIESEKEYSGYYAGISASGVTTLNYHDASGWVTLNERDPGLSLRSDSIPNKAGKKYHLRVDAFGGTFRLYVDDMTIPKIEVNDYRTLNGAMGFRVVNGQTHFGNFQVNDPFVRLKPQKMNRFLDHDSRNKDLVRLDDNVNRDDDALWRLTPCLADSNGISFQSARMPGFYLRDQNGHIIYEKDDGSPQFKKETTWMPVKGLADPNLYSYESLTHPGEYLRNKNKLAARMPVQSEDDQSDATFEQMK